jgi:multiple antibiotic resistance protein
VTLAALVANLLIVMLALRFAEGLAARIGATTMRAISRLVALLLAAIAINLIRRGWQASG